MPQENTSHQVSPRRIPKNRFMREEMVVDDGVLYEVLGIDMKAGIPHYRLKKMDTGAYLGKRIATFDRSASPA